MYSLYFYSIYYKAVKFIFYYYVELHQTYFQNWTSKVKLGNYLYNFLYYVKQNVKKLKTIRT